MIDSYDSVLLEIANHPSSEAVFATMAVQLKADGGFDRVLALLNELVEDGRSQLHKANLIWRATSSRCEVTTMKFNERQEYYESRHEVLVSESDDAEKEAGYAADTTAFLGTAQEWFTKFAAEEKARHEAESKALEAVLADATEAVTSVEAAIAAVNDWQAQGTAFVQTALNKLTTSYLQVNKYKIVIPESFVQMAASDEAVKTRLLEWLSSLRVSFAESKDEAESVIKAKNTLWGQIETGVAALLEIYTTDSKFSAGQHANLVEDSISLKASAELFTRLISDNANLVKANAEYCSVEKTNYEKVKTVLDEQLALFKKIRDYFRTNYAKINKFVKEKYHH